MQERMLKFFQCRAPSPQFTAVNEAYGQMANIIAKATPSSPERTVALRKLLESRDAMFRAIAEALEG